MSALSTTGSTATGSTVALPISSTAYTNTIPLAAGANTGSLATNKSGFIDLQGYLSFFFVLLADQIGSYTIEYSVDGINPVPQLTATVPYDAGLVTKQRVGAIGPRGRFVRLTFTNTSQTNQSYFYMWIALSTSEAQASLETLADQLADTRLSLVVKAVLQGKDSNGVYDALTRTGNSLNVNITNPMTATDVSALAKDATLTNGNAKVQVTNLPATQSVSGTVSIGNFPASTEIANDVGNPIPVIGAVTVSNFPVTQPISAGTLPLPTGAAKETGGNLDTITAQLTSINADQGTPTDAAVTDPTVTAGEIALLKGILSLLKSGIATQGNPFTPKSFNYGTSGAVTGVQQVKTGVGAIGGILCNNLTSADVYIQIFDVAAATTVTLGTTVPTYFIPVDATVPLIDNVLTILTTGCKFAITTSPTGATIASQAVITFKYR